jgi:hypothetical protein
MAILSSRIIEDDIQRIRDKQAIVLKNMWTSREYFTPDEIADYLKFEVTGGFWKVDNLLEDSEYLPVDAKTAKDVVRSMLFERINELEGSDLCGAPWARVELRSLRYMMKNFNKWWKEGSFVEGL